MAENIKYYMFIWIYISLKTFPLNLFVVWYGLILDDNIWDWYKCRVSSPLSAVPSHRSKVLSVAAHPFLFDFYTSAVEIDCGMQECIVLTKERE